MNGNNDETELMVKKIVDLIRSDKLSASQINCISTALGYNKRLKRKVKKVKTFLNDTKNRQLEYKGHEEIVEIDPSIDFEPLVVKELSLEERVAVICDNLKKCVEPIVSEPIICKSFGSILKIESPLISLEDSLLNVATSNAADAVFFCCVVQHGTHMMARYFEYGAFEGLFRGKICPHLLKDGVVLLPWSVYTAHDVKMNFKNNHSKVPEGEEVRNLYKRNMNINEKSVRKMIPLLQNLLKEDQNVKLLNLSVCVFHKNKKGAKKEIDKNYFFFHEGSDYDWWELFREFRVNRVGFVPETDLLAPINVDATFVDKAFYLSALPNLHYWKWYYELGPVHVRHHQRFSVKCSVHNDNRPASPRNRIICAFNSRDGDKGMEIISKVLQHIHGKKDVQIYNKRKSITKQETPNKKRIIAYSPDESVATANVTAGALDAADVIANTDAGADAIEDADVIANTDAGADALDAAVDAPNTTAGTTPYASLAAPDAGAAVVCDPPYHTIPLYPW